MMGKMRGSYIDSIHIFNKRIKIVICFYSMFLGKQTGFVHRRIEDLSHFNTIHHFCFRNKPMCNATTANYSQTISTLALSTQLRTTDTLCPRKIYYLTVFFQIIKFSFPVATNSKDIHIIPLYIINLLS